MTDATPTGGMPATSGPSLAGGDHDFRTMPTTRRGRQAKWVGLAFLVMFFINNAFVGIFGTRETGPALRGSLMVWGWSMLAVGLASGGLSLWAVVRERERSWLTWLTMLPALMVLTLLVGELLGPH